MFPVQRYDINKGWGNSGAEGCIGSEAAMHNVVIRFRMVGMQAVWLCQSKDAVGAFHGAAPDTGGVDGGPPGPIPELEVMGISV